MSKPGATGFMLIELAVAALVIAIGVLALLSVAHVGERAAADSENETRAALFADEVFTTMRLYSDQVSATTNRQGWLDFWREFVEGTRPLPVANTLIGLETAAELEASDTPCIIGDSQVHTNRWYPGALTSTAHDDEPPDFAVQYKLSIQYRPEHGEPAWFDPADTNTTPSILWATLHVWNGAFRSHPEPFTFYTHFSDAGGLP